MHKEAQAVTPVDDFFACGSAPVPDLQAQGDTMAPRELAGFLRESLGKRVTVQVIAKRQSCADTGAADSGGGCTSGLGTPTA